MRAIVDTSVWSLALRRSKAIASAYRDLLSELLQDGRAILMGVVRQEILSGIKFSEQFDRLKNHLRSFPDLQIETEDYEVAAAFYNACMSSGVHGSPTDFLISACAYRRKYAILTADPDFLNYKKHIPIALLQPKE